MFIRNENNRGVSLTKSQMKVVNETLSDALKRCECSGDLLKAIDALFEIYKEANDGKQGIRLKEDKEAEARANKFGVIVDDETVDNFYCYMYKDADNVYESAKFVYDISSVKSVKLARYDASGDEIETIKETIFDR